MGLTSKSFSSKLLLVYHPDRCRGRVCLDLHNGKHGVMTPSTRAWGLDCARDVLASIGGVAALFPLLYLVLIAGGSEQHDHGMLEDGPPCGGDETWLYRTDSELDRERQGSLAVLLSILARILRAHEINQRELYRIGGRCTCNPSLP